MTPLEHGFTMVTPCSPLVLSGRSPPPPNNIMDPVAILCVSSWVLVATKGGALASPPLTERQGPWEPLLLSKLSPRVMKTPLWTVPLTLILASNFPLRVLPMQGMHVLRNRFAAVPIMVVVFLVKSGKSPRVLTSSPRVLLLA